MPEMPLQKLQERLALAEQSRYRRQKRTRKVKSEEDSYVWTMLDLMTLLLIFFITFYSHAASQLHISPIPPEQTAPQSQSLIDHTASSAASVWNDPNKIWDKTRLRDQLEKTLKRNIPAGTTQSYQILNDKNKMVVILGEQITFRPGEAKIIASFQPVLKNIAEVISTRLTGKVEIAGHTDDTPIHTNRFPSNWELAAERAVQVAKFLIAHGVDPHRVSTRAFAEYSPRYDNISAEFRRANRRVEITLIH